MSLLLAAGAAPTNLAGQIIVYVLFPLIVLGIAGGVGWLVTISRRLTTQDKALALLMSEVSPQGSPGLRELVTSARLEVATLKGLVSNREPGAPHE